MALDIVAGLSLQTQTIGSMTVEHYGARLIPALPTERKQPIPELRVLAATCRAGPQAFIKRAHDVVSLATESHVGARAYLPDGSGDSLTLFEEASSEAHASVSVVEASERLLEHNLRLCRELFREHKTGDGHDLGPGEAFDQPSQPIRVHGGIVVSEGHELAHCILDSGVASNRETPS
jgi:hypothetical protein